MRLTLYCLAIAVGMRLAFDTATGQMNIGNDHAYVLPGKIGLHWRLHDEDRVWLELRSADREAWPKEGFNPSFTSIITEYRPLVNQLPNGKFEVTFTMPGKIKEAPP
jgi:hypothetical protein